jgi:hypothetical protein
MKKKLIITEVQYKRLNYTLTKKNLKENFGQAPDGTETFSILTKAMVTYAKEQGLEELKNFIAQNLVNIEEEMFGDNMAYDQYNGETPNFSA